MFKLLIFSTLLLLVIHSDINLGNAEDLRRGRMYRNTQTTTVTKFNVATSIVPSSCIQVDATLPLCKNVRFLKMPRLPTVTFNNSRSEKGVKNWREEQSKIETTRLGWGEYFGLYAPTVTVTTTALNITVVEDPSVVVTFAIKGCIPLKIPMDLHRCPVEYTSSSVKIDGMLTTSTIALPVVSAETLLPTRTMVAVKPTKLSDLPEKNTFEDNSNLLEPSPHEITENKPAQPTDALV